MKVGNNLDFDQIYNRVYKFLLWNRPQILLYTAVGYFYNKHAFITIAEHILSRRAV